MPKTTTTMESLLKELRIDIDEEKFIGLLRSAFDAAVGRTAEVAEGGDLTAVERQALEGGGFLAKRTNPERRSPAFMGALAYAAIVASSLKANQAAKLLGVNPSRIRQRLLSSRPTLYGIKSHREWLLPRFQFHHNREVPGIAEVVPHLPSNLNPVAVISWFDAPNPDLVTDDEETVLSPRDWLMEGRNPRPVAELAEQL